MWMGFTWVSFLISAAIVFYVVYLLLRLPAFHTPTVIGRKIHEKSMLKPLHLLWYPTLTIIMDHEEGGVAKKKEKGRKKHITLTLAEAATRIDVADVSAFLAETTDYCKRKESLYHYLVLLEVYVRE